MSAHPCGRLRISRVQGQTFVCVTMSLEDFECPLRRRHLVHDLIGFAQIVSESPD